MKLSKAQRRVLEYVRDQGTVVMWPAAILPANRVRNVLEDAGLLERRQTASLWRGWGITTAGRAALEADSDPDPHALGRGRG